jgi:hypothetical protein
MMTDITGIDEAQAAIDRLMEALRPGGELDRTTESGAEEGAKFASQIAPRKSGALSRAIEVIPIGQLFGVGINQGAVAPKGGRPHVYGPIVADNVLDFFQRTGDQRGNQIVQHIFDAFVEAAE